jgi:hypothetical protein
MLLIALISSLSGSLTTGVKKDDLALLQPGRIDHRVPKACPCKEESISLAVFGSQSSRYLQRKECKNGDRTLRNIFV